MRVSYLSFLFLAACAAPALLPPVPDPLPTGLDDTCQASRYAAQIGQDVSSLEVMLDLRPVRIIRPGSVVTQDYLPARTNFELAVDETIQRITCG